MPAPEGIRLPTGGETSRHIYPAMAIADELAATVPGSTSIFVGAAGRIDSGQTFGHRYATQAVDMGCYDRKNLIGNFSLTWKLVKSLHQSLKILNQFQPDVVLGVGAFPSVPVGLAARLKRKPLLLFEPNALPGLANKLLSRWAKRICVTQSGMEAFFPPAKLVVTGTPVRTSLLNEASNAPAARQFFGIPDRERVVLITGGSTGSTTLNRIVVRILEFLAGQCGHLIWQTGERDSYKINLALSKTGPKNCTVLPYLEKMGYAYAAADLIVSSAGASSVAELSLLNKAVILIPDPEVTENHQFYNARNLQEQEACLLLEAYRPEREAAEQIIELLNDRPKLERLGNNLGKLARADAARLIVEQIRMLAGRGFY